MGSLLVYVCNLIILSNNVLISVSSNIIDCDAIDVITIIIIIMMIIIIYYYNFTSLCAKYSSTTDLSIHFQPSRPTTI